MIRIISFLSATALCACVATEQAPVAEAAAAEPAEKTEIALIRAEGPQDPVAETVSVVNTSGQPIEEPLEGRPPLVKPTFEEEKSESEKLARKADYAEAMAQVEDRQRVFANAETSFSLDGSFAQGGLVFGQTEPGAEVRLDGEKVMVGDDGRFVIGFGRDSALTALLTVKKPDGSVERKSLEIEDREFKVERIDGIDQSKVSGFTEEQLEKIGRDSAKKKEARKVSDRNAFWAGGFDWPLTGRISGVFGSQRILNGEPKRPHSGVDVARPTGTPIKAPADGIVRLAESDMYFEGGLVLLDHGHKLESAFLHMSRIDVAPGQKVKKGDVLGAVGATGRVTGPHLHWSVKWVGPPGRPATSGRRDAERGGQRQLIHLIWRIFTLS